MDAESAGIIMMGMMKFWLYVITVPLAAYFTRRLIFD